MSSPNNPRVFNGKRIVEFKAGDKLSAEKLNELVGVCNSLLNARIVKGSRDEVIISDAGSFYQIVRDGASATTSGSASADKFRIKSYQGTHIICRTWDGITEGAVDVLIALSPEIRSSITSETIAGITYTFSGYDNSTQYRLSTRSSDSTTEDQYITPRFLVNQEILAIKVNGSTTVVVSGTALEYQAITGREWAAV